MTAIPHGRPPFRHPGCSGHCAAQNPTPLSTLKFHDWRSSGRRFAGQLHFVSGYTDDVRFGSKADIRTAIDHVRFSPESGQMRRTRSCLLWAKSRHWPAIVRYGSGQMIGPSCRRYWSLQRASAKAPQRNIAPNAAANQAGGPLSRGFLKMLIAPTQSATPMPRQVNRRIYFHTIIAASKALFTCPPR